MKHMTKKKHEKSYRWSGKIEEASNSTKASKILMFKFGTNHPKNSGIVVVNVGANENIRITVRVYAASGFSVPMHAINTDHLFFWREGV